MPDQHARDFALDDLELAQRQRCVAKLTLLDTLLDASALCQPGIDADVYAAELRTIALQLETLTRQVEALAPIPTRETAYPEARDASISA